MPFKMSFLEENKCILDIKANQKVSLLMNNKNFDTSNSSFKYSCGRDYQSKKPNHPKQNLDV